MWLIKLHVQRALAVCGLDVSLARQHFNKSIQMALRWGENLWKFETVCIKAVTEKKLTMEHWKFVTIMVTVLAFALEFQPIDSFLTAFLVGPTVGASLKQVKSHFCLNSSIHSLFKLASHGSTNVCCKKNFFFLIKINTILRKNPCDVTRSSLLVYSFNFYPCAIC